MSIRGNMNKHPQAVAGAVIVVVALVVWQIVFRTGAAPEIPTKAWYTTDDGKTWFVDSLYKATPFDHEGKQAYGVVLFKCGATGQPFAGFVTRTSPAIYKDLKALVESNDANLARKFESYQRQGGVEMKKLGDKTWYDGASGMGQRIYGDAVKCQGGGQADSVDP